jgi:hypothetical protein
VPGLPQARRCPAGLACVRLPRSARARIHDRGKSTVGLIDALVNRSFRETPAGRVVVFSGDPRKRGYLVRSPADEQKIRSFLKMFYFADLSILGLGILVSQGCASWFAYGSYDRPAYHLLGSVSIFVAVYGLVVGLPYALLWRAYKRALPSFTDAADEVSLTGINAPRRQWILQAVAGFALLILALILVLAVRPKVP